MTQADPKPGRPATRCPGCGVEAISVRRVTLEALLTPGARSRISDAPYRFCASRNCSVVYFSEAGGSVFEKSDLSVRVGMKETSAPRPVCYCFDHTAEEIEEEVQRTGDSTVLEDIQRRMKNEGCSCATRNPRGSCCISTVRTFIEEARIRLAGKPAPSAGAAPEATGPCCSDCCCGGGAS